MGDVAQLFPFRQNGKLLFRGKVGQDGVSIFRPIEIGGKMLLRGLGPNGIVYGYPYEEDGKLYARTGGTGGGCIPLSWRTVAYHEYDSPSCYAGEAVTIRTLIKGYTRRYDLTFSGDEHVIVSFAGSSQYDWVELWHDPPVWWLQSASDRRNGYCFHLWSGWHTSAEKWVWLCAGFNYSAARCPLHRWLLIFTDTYEKPGYCALNWDNACINGEPTMNLRFPHPLSAPYESAPELLKEHPGVGTLEDIEMIEGESCYMRMYAHSSRITISGVPVTYYDEYYGETVPIGNLNGSYDMPWYYNRPDDIGAECQYSLDRYGYTDVIQYVEGSKGRTYKLAIIFDHVLGGTWNCRIGMTAADGGYHGGWRPRGSAMSDQVDGVWGYFGESAVKDPWTGSYPDTVEYSGDYGYVLAGASVGAERV